MKSSGFLGEEAAAGAAAKVGQVMDEIVARHYEKERRQATEVDAAPTRSGRTWIQKDEKVSEEKLEEEKERAMAEDDDFSDDDELERLREQRLAAMKKEQAQKIENLGKGHGQYREITEDEFLKEVTGSKYVVCAFYHRDFERCKIVDKHLYALAPVHTETKFIRINAEKAPFFITKLGVRMLPTIICFIGGIAQDRIVGFDELGGRDDFPTVNMRRRLAEAEAIEWDDPAASAKKEKKVTSIYSSQFKSADSDDDL